MASTEELNSDNASDAARDDLKGRRRARSVVNEALLKVATPLEIRGVERRFLPGLWNAAINIILHCYEQEDVLALLKDRARGIVGDGSNADAAPKSIPDKAMRNYVAEVQKAAEAIMESLDTALEFLKEEELDDRFPEAALDATLQILIQAWGPHHVRRAISEQSALIIRGVEAVANFMEPTRLQEPTPARKPEPVRAPPSPIIPDATPAAPERGTGDVRTANAYATSDIAPDGTAAWAAAILFHDETGRSELREISGTMRDPSGRAVAIIAVRECVVSACDGTPKIKMVLETPSEQCVRAAAGGGAPGSRLSGEDAIWDDIDRAIARHEIEFRHAQHSLDRDLKERCDRMLRQRLDS